MAFCTLSKFQRAARQDHSRSARAVFDSRGNFTVEVNVKYKAGKVLAGMPCWAVTSIHETLEFLSSDHNAHLGKDAGKAVANAK